MAVERTLSIVKPDAVAKNVIGDIYSMFEKAQLEDRRRPHDAPVRRNAPGSSTRSTRSVRSTRIWCPS